MRRLARPVSSRTHHPQHDAAHLRSVPAYRLHALVLERAASVVGYRRAFRSLSFAKMLKNRSLNFANARFRPWTSRGRHCIIWNPSRSLPGEPLKNTRSITQALHMPNLMWSAVHVALAE